MLIPKIGQNGVCVSDDIAFYFSTLLFFWGTLTGFNWQDFLAEWRYRLRRSTGFGKKSSGYVTGLSWKDYCAGKRDRLRSRRQQEEMLSIWPDLFTGMRGQLAILRPGARKTLPNGRPVPKRVMRFSDDVIRQFEAGELIDGTCEESAEINPI
ncbi:hypothetical protein AZF01_22150 (plasmid) [Martelella sp. AD-3]|nr:hypothetical protein AZF01_22150 [Martelella sp. AD-3]